MALQLFGTIETAAGNATAMLCIDADRPNEYLIQTSGQGISPMGIRAEATVRGSIVELKGAGLLRPLENGALHYPVLTAEDREQLGAMRATLAPTPTGMAGAWTGLGGAGGAINLAELTAAPLNVEQCDDWTGFKRWADRSRQEMDAVIYRGHGSAAFRLQTTLHRAGRHRLERYCMETLSQFHMKAEAVLSMRLNMGDGWDYATVLGLAQHHGLPTPLLDWTESPYIAAFFAFADALESERSRPADDKVRIYGLARHFVDNTSPSLVVLPVANPYAASLAISARLNPRLHAQQGRFMVTNVANLEAWISNIEASVGRPILCAAEVPARCAREALEDLAFMGLTASTMFPGLDGVCRSLRHAMSFTHAPAPSAGVPADTGPSTEIERLSGPVADTPGSMG